MFSSDIPGFLEELKKNNNREWFQANKKWYEQCRADFELFITLLISEIGKFDRSIGSLKASDCLFRIYRDIRFSPDKTPYKTNFGAYIARGGRKSEFAGYYFHIEPGNCMLAGGIYMPSKEILKAIREEIFHNPEDILAIIHNKEFRKVFPAITGEQLKTAPQGYPKDWEYIDLLKFKDYNLVRPFMVSDMKKKNFLEFVTETYRMMYPFNEYLNGIILQVV
jgi:uncharacterized protein (TIGR02453 family)